MAKNNKSASLGEITASIKSALQAAIEAATKPSRVQVVTSADLVVEALVERTRKSGRVAWADAATAQKDLHRTARSLPSIRSGNWPKNDALFARCLLGAEAAIATHGLKLSSRKRPNGETEFLVERSGSTEKAAKRITAAAAKAATVDIISAKDAKDSRVPWTRAKRSSVSADEAALLAQSVYAKHGPRILLGRDFVEHARATGTFALVTAIATPVVACKAASSVIKRLVASGTFGGYRYSTPAGDRSKQQLMWQVLLEDALPNASGAKDSTKPAPAKRPSPKRLGKLGLDATDIALAVEAGVSLGPGSHTPAELIAAFEREGLFRDVIASRESLGRSRFAGRIMRLAAENPPPGYVVSVRSSDHGMVFWEIKRTSITAPPPKLSGVSDVPPKLAIVPPIVEDPKDPAAWHLEASPVWQRNVDEATAAEATQDNAAAHESDDTEEDDQEEARPHRLSDELPRLYRASILRPIVIFGGLIEPRKYEWAQNTMLNVEWLPTERDHGVAQTRALAQRVLDGKVAAVVFLNGLFRHRNYQPVQDAARVRGIKVAFAGKGGQGALRMAFQSLETQLAGADTAGAV